jgi:hypothetical protein
MNCVEGTVTENGLKWSKKQKRRSEVRENELLNEKIKDDILTRKMDRGQLNKWKNTPMDALEHRAGKKEKSLKKRVNLT